jgi:hypothetical protein
MEGKAWKSVPWKVASRFPHSVHSASTIVEMREMWLLAEQMKENTFSTGS